MHLFLGLRTCLSVITSITIVATGAWLAIVPNTASGQGGGTPDADTMFRQLDTNKDDKLTKTEVGPNAKGLIDQIFRMAGKPDSGSLSREEFQTVFDKHRSASGSGNGPRERGAEPPNLANDGGLPPILRTLDGNNDQRLTRSELTRLTQLFDRLDTNKDGALNVAELQAADSLTVGDDTENDRTRTAGSTGGRTTERSSPEGVGSSARRVGANSSLAGVWRGWIVHGRGENPNEGEMEIELTIEGNRMTGRELGTRRGPAEGLGAGTFTMTGNGRTGNLDADGTSGSQDGRHSMGIYELDGQTLKWCVTQRNRQRPQVMATDRGNYLLILRKQSARN